VFVSFSYSTCIRNGNSTRQYTSIHLVVDATCNSASLDHSQPAGFLLRLRHRQRSDPAGRLGIIACLPTFSYVSFSDSSLVWVSAKLALIP
jgi:hypothetical protein